MPKLINILQGEINQIKYSAAVTYPKIPLFRCLQRRHVIISNGDKCAVVEQRNQHEHQNGHVEEAGPVAVVRVVAGLIVDRLEEENGDEKED